MVTNEVRRWLRAEGLWALLLLAVLYARSGGKWWIFLVCFLLPDLSMLGYVRGPRIGASVYNWAHCYWGPALLGLVSLGKWRAGLLAALIWGAHIGFDRMLGYGLKYPEAFGSTHLGWVGNQRQS